MNKRQAITVLKNHQEWRRGKASEMQPPGTIGEAIDTAIRLLSKPEKPKRKRFKWIRLKPEKKGAKK